MGLQQKPGGLRGRERRGREENGHPGIVQPGDEGWDGVRKGKRWNKPKDGKQSEKSLVVFQKKKRNKMPALEGSGVPGALRAL